MNTNKGVVTMVKEKKNLSNDNSNSGQHQKTLDEIKRKSPMDWGVLDLAEAVQHQTTNEE
ncbi:hypothetical protein J7E81_10395 [Bacillus sp. ISL-18]|uniref:hypothetical protein n=1 Tax=Bacillus sp. ISL-18 TaxID=2819118 RepID=UPI001BE70B07|nr:hypothetical protein [Bacillus sp. ISL-18]MBT2655637.1 hypothetical protein [Bacillus sp. ISL-18]